MLRCEQRCPCTALDDVALTWANVNAVQQNKVALAETQAKLKAKTMETLKLQEKWDNMQSRFIEMERDMRRAEENAERRTLEVCGDDGHPCERGAANGHRPSLPHTHAQTTHTRALCVIDLQWGSSCVGVLQTDFLLTQLSAQESAVELMAETTLCEGVGNAVIVKELDACTFRVRKAYVPTPVVVRVWHHSPWRTPCIACILAVQVSRGGSCVRAERNSEEKEIAMCEPGNVFNNVDITPVDAKSRITTWTC